MKIFNKLFKKKIYQDGHIYLKEDYRTSEKTSYDGVPTIYYNIFLTSNNDKVGKIELRLTADGDDYYYGHIGYNIYREFRGNNYAYSACKIIFDIAKNEFNFNELIITCSPENIASYKTLQKLEGELIETVDVPKYHSLYRLGETKKHIFRYKLV